jgi:NitT/TauT family transport system permease protein
LRTGGVLQRLGNLLAPAAALLAVGVVWEAAVAWFKLPAYLLPPPSAVIAAGAESFGFILTHLFITLGTIAIGFTLGALLGIVTASAIVYSPLAGRLIYPLVVLTQSIPKVTIAPILLVWFGIGIGSKLALIILMVYFPVVVNTVTGLSAVEPYALDLLRSLHASRLQVFWLLRLPNALLGIFDGLKLAVTMSIIAAILAEFIGSNEGIGWLILVAKTNMDLSLSFAAIAVISLAAIVLFALMSQAQRLVVHWQPLQ